MTTDSQGRDGAALYVRTVPANAWPGPMFAGFEDEAGDRRDVPYADVPATEDRNALRFHGPLYSAEHVADLEATMRMLAREVLRTANGLPPSVEACVVAERVYGETKGSVAS